MDAAESEHIKEQTAKAFPDQLPLSDPPVRDGVHDEPDLSPRVGSDYQVEIPALETEVGQSQVEASLDTGLPAIQNDFGTGLAIPVLWLRHNANCIQYEHKDFVASTVDAVAAVRSLNNKSNEYVSNDKSKMDAKYNHIHGCSTEDASYFGIHPPSSTCKVEIDFICSAKDINKYGFHKLAMIDNKMDLDSSLEEQCKVEGYSPLPGIPATSWSDAETESFLAGLYIFGKNFVQVRKFIESKGMGDIQTYYYGKFYRSDAHHRWSEFRNIKSKRCIVGQRIFTGWRQQELLSRLLPTVSKEVQDSLLEATKTFNEGSTSFEVYVSTLKAAVGMQVLVNAVGIGKGKRDLTGIISDPNRTNQALLNRHEIPIGKACSSLSPGEIIKFLTGDFRLSKARANDLFWEAVWPRLLANGWHSEQPKDLKNVGSKQSLVFLTPAVKKFSRKKMVKGNHYFDCVSDVLSKVASDSRLLELDNEGSKGNISSKDENGWAMDTTLNQHNMLSHQRQSYLCPRVPICNSELMKFMVIDTSVVQGESPTQIRELRKLPIDAINIYSTIAQTEETGNCSSGEHQDSDKSLFEGDSAETSPHNEELEHESFSRISQALVYTQLDYTDADASTKMSIDNHISKNQYVEQLADKLPDIDADCRFSLKPNSGHQVYLSPNAKRRRMAESEYEDAGNCALSSPTSYQHKEEHTLVTSSLLKPTDEIIPGSDHSQGNSYPFSAAKDTSNDKVNLASSEHNLKTSVSTGTNLFLNQPESYTSINLNLVPCTPLGNGPSEQLSSNTVNSQFDLNAKNIISQLERKQQTDCSIAAEAPAEVKGDKKFSESSRRQSTRNRPPTTKALEALAFGYMGNKRKGRDAKSVVSETMRPTRRARKTVDSRTSVPQPNVPQVDVASASAGFRASNFVVDNWYQDTSMSESVLSEPFAKQSDRNGSNELLGLP